MELKPSAWSFSQDENLANTCKRCVKNVQIWRFFWSVFSHICRSFTSAVLNTKAKNIENKIADNTRFIDISEINRLARIHFSVKTGEITRNLVTNGAITTDLDLGEKSRERLDEIELLQCFLVKVILIKTECEVI